MLVGHLPFMAKLVSMLVTGKEQPIIVNYQPGTVVCVARDDEGCWQVEWMLRPDTV